MIGKRSLTKQNKPIKICIIIDAWKPIWGGGQTHVWEISKILINKYNYNIDIFTKSYSNKSDVNHISPENHYKSKLRVFRIGPKSSLHNYVARTVWMFLVILYVIYNHRKDNYSVIHGHAFISGIPAAILGKLTGRPVIYTAHGSHNLDLGKRSIIRFLEEILLTKIPYDHLITVSKSFLKYKNVNRNISVIPNGVDIRRFSTIRKKLERNHIFTALWVGRFDKYKGLDLLVRAVRSVIQNNHKIRLFLIGSGGEYTNIFNLVKSLNLESIITFVGQLHGSELIRFYKNADIFVLPSLAEGQPISLFEAWAAKLPVIATIVGDNPYLIKHGYNGYLIRPNNSRELSKILIKSMQSTDLQRLGERGYAMVKLHYTWKLTAEKLVQIYKRYV